MNDFPTLDRARLLRNIAITFVVLTVALLGVVAYAAFSRAQIVVTLAPINKDVSYQISLVEESLGGTIPAGSLPATFFETTAAASDNFTVSVKDGSSEYAGGTVVIHNESTRDQPLVATTRFLSADGKLFRLVEAVRVPAGALVSVIIRADGTGEQFLAVPGRFTIPGLSETLQQQIYATSGATLVLGGADARVVSAQDIENARQTLLQKIRGDASTEITARVAAGDIAEKDFSTTIIKETVSVKPGASVASFSVSLEARVVAVAFKKAQLDDRIVSLAGGNVVVIEGTRTYTLNVAEDKRSGVLNGTATVHTGIDQTSSIFSPVNFVGATPKEIQDFLMNFEGISNVAVAISPYWQRHLPRLPSRIHVEFR